MALGPHGEPLPESSVRRSKSFELEPAAGRQESAGPKLKLLQPKRKLAMSEARHQHARRPASRKRAAMHLRQSQLKRRSANWVDV